MERSPLTISLYAPDVQAAVDFYADTFGFEQSGSWVEGERMLWAEVQRPGLNGMARIWFFSDAIRAGDQPGQTGMVYLFLESLDAVDSMASAVNGKAKVRWGPENMPYGLREVGVEDLNGYLLVFAHDLAPESA